MPVKPAKGAKPVKPAKSVKPVKLAKNARPMKPVKSVKPARISKPVVAVKAAAPAKPVKKKPAKAAQPPKAAKPARQPGLLEAVLAHLDDAKAEEIVTISLNGKGAIADDMVVASGRSNRHVGAIADQLVDKLKASGHRHIRVVGMDTCDWVLVDAVDVIVHLFRPEVRSFYNLEKLWSEHSPQEPHAE